jgi:aspartyl protease family protein
MSRRLVWLVLLAAGLSLVMLAIQHEGGTGGPLSGAAMTGLMAKLALVVIIGASLASLFRQRFADTLEFALMWVVIALIGAVGYTYRGELSAIGQRVFAEVTGREAPLVTGSLRGPTVEIAKGRAGDFPLTMKVNNADIGMVLDTGASQVVLTHEAARAAGLPMVLLDFDVPVDTANGRTRAAAVVLDRIQIGGIVERKVPALIAQPGQLKISLLGMTFLSRLESWEVRDGRVILRGAGN